MVTLLGLFELSTKSIKSWCFVWLWNIHKIWIENLMIWELLDIFNAKIFFYKSLVTSTVLNYTQHFIMGFQLYTLLRPNTLSQPSLYIFNVCFLLNCRKGIVLLFYFERRVVKYDILHWANKYPFGKEEFTWYHFKMKKNISVLFWTIP